MLENYEVVRKIGTFFCTLLGVVVPARLRACAIPHTFFARVEFEAISCEADERLQQYRSWKILGGL